MRYVELAFTVAADTAEQWGALLCEQGAQGVEERDLSTLQAAPSGQATLVVWIAPDEADRFVERTRAAATGLAEPTVLRRDRDEDEWRDAWKRHFGARAVGRFVIVPSWVERNAAEGEIAIALDPGRAFGTGGHASTRLCLEALSGLLDEGSEVTRFFDVGCGSGVLAIACALAWPEATGAGVDVDPDAIEVSRENAARNRVDERIEFAVAAEQADAFEVVTANIQPEVLIPLAPSLALRLAPGGRIILSGILVEAADAVERAYLAEGLRLARRLDEDGWRALVLERPRTKGAG
ncbi:MAG: 50S ribosomal protein L11 methyltransferase [Polyangia bacterium]